MGNNIAHNITIILLLLTICNTLIVNWPFTDHGADVKAQEKTGATALYIAAQEGHLDVCRILLGMCPRY